MNEVTELNPCRISELNSDATKRVDSSIRYYPSSGKPEPVQHTNLKTIQATYGLAVELLQAQGKERFIPYLAYCLVPRFGDSETGLSGSKIGGIPDLRTYVYLKDNLDRLEQVWPRCGCCHTMLKFVGQFDLLPWALPIHAAFSQPLPGHPRGDYAQVSGIGRHNMSQHASVFNDTLWHLFVCPNASQHWDIPSADACVFVTTKFSRDVGATDLVEAASRWEDRVRQLAAKYPHVIRTAEYIHTDEDHFDVSPRRIVGYDFRLEFDQAPRDYPDDLEELEDAHSDIFANWSEDFTLFGGPKSQQAPQRYFSTYGLPGSARSQPLRMTPFIRFNDENADMTYQIYADTANSSGYTIYCKVDASCT